METHLHKITAPLHRTGYIAAITIAALCAICLWLSFSGDREQEIYNRAPRAVYSTEWPVFLDETKQAYAQLEEAAAVKNRSDTLNAVSALLEAYRSFRRSSPASIKAMEVVYSPEAEAEVLDLLREYSARRESIEASLNSQTRGVLLVYGDEVEVRLGGLLTAFEEDTMQFETELRNLSEAHNAWIAAAGGNFEKLPPAWIEKGKDAWPDQ
jgi:hypothetical protein